MTEPDADSRSAGFMLIEVVIALAIVAVAFSYTFQNLSVALDRVGRNRNSAEALLLAQSTLDRVGFDIGLGQGDISGKTDDGFSWLVQTTPYGGTNLPTSIPLAGYIVRVTVGWNERANPRQVQLTTVRIGYRVRSS